MGIFWNAFLAGLGFFAGLALLGLLFESLLFAPL